MKTIGGLEYHVHINIPNMFSVISLFMSGHIYLP